MQADPVRAKVHKNLNRYAEDSLDARLRQLKNNADLQLEDLNGSENYKTINMSNKSRGGSSYNVVFHQPRDEPQAVHVPIQPHHLI